MSLGRSLKMKNECVPDCEFNSECEAELLLFFLLCGCVVNLYSP